MNITEVRNLVKSAIAEAMEKSGLPKSGGKLVHLKKVLAGLQNMKESLGQLQIAEGGDQQFVAEYAHMQKFVNELEKIKAAHAKLSEMLDNQIGEVDSKIVSETQKIKEMIGLAEPAAKKTKDEAKKKVEPKDKKEEPKAEPKAEPKKKTKELDEAAEEKEIKESFTYTNDFKQWEKDLKDRFSSILGKSTKREKENGEIQYVYGNRILASWEPNRPNNIPKGAVGTNGGTDYTDPGSSFTGYHGD
jgi:hypothetical protein